MTFKQILADIEKRIFQPIYFLWGEEPYFIDEITDKIMHTVLSESEKDFNQTVLYGKDTTTHQIVETAKRFPMMANHQVVIVKEAQELKDIKLLESYVENPLKSTILVFNYRNKKIDKRLKVFKLLEKHAVLFEAKQVPENQINARMESWLLEHNLQIEPKASMLVTENVGSQLSKIVNELKKLKISMPEGKHLITDQMVIDNIGISREYNVFELQRAIGLKDTSKAYRIIHFFAKNPRNYPAVLTIGVLFSYFKKIIILHTLKDKSKNNIAASIGVPPFYVDEYKKVASKYSLRSLVEIVSIFREFDMKIKGVGAGETDEGELMREMVYKIIHA
jgi:DNA polymerase III subunit delta